MLFTIRGDGISASMKRTFVGLASLTLALSMTVACGDDAPGEEAETGETGDGDGDGDVGDGDGDSTGDGDGDPAGDGDGDGDTEPEPDTDMDGVGDSTDNCVDIPNPNQLDFDGNGAGNVCDTQVFTGVSGNLNTTAGAEAFGQGCGIPLMINVSSGEVRVQLDDDAAVAGFEIVNLVIDDVPDQDCNLGFITATVSLSDFNIANGGDAFPVAMVHDLAQHDGGQVAGESDMPHPVLATATLSADIGQGPLPSELDLDGALPIFTANITEGGAMGVLSWADPDFVVATDVFMVDALGMMVDINFELRGLIGSVVLVP